MGRLMWQSSQTAFDFIFAGGGSVAVSDDIVDGKKLTQGIAQYYLNLLHLFHFSPTVSLTINLEQNLLSRLFPLTQHVTCYMYDVLMLHKYTFQHHRGIRITIHHRSALPPRQPQTQPPLPRA